MKFYLSVFRDFWKLNFKLKNSGEQEIIHYSREGRIEKSNLSLGITVCHRSASLVMPSGDPRDEFFYPTLTHMIDSFNPPSKISK